MNETTEGANQEILDKLDEQKKAQRDLKRVWFSGGIITGLVIALLISCVTYMVGLKKSTQVSVVGSNVKATKEESSVVSDRTIQKLRILENSINKYYLGDISREALENGVYKGFVEATGDPYASYFTKEELEELRISTEGIYYGIGAYVGVDKETGYCKISGVMENTPAQEAGLMAEDVIVKVNGEDMRGLDATEVVDLIKGEENTDVVLTIYRVSEPDYIDITVTRRRVEAPTVEYEMLDNGIAYIQITQFEVVTGGQFEEKLAKAREEGMKGLIIDLRGNPGGTLGSVVDVARQMLPEGLIVYMEDKNGKRDEFKCDGEKQLEVPLVVLVNENSASAAEILAGAVKDYGIGTLVGETTFGKGIVQKVFTISDGSGMKLTISHYYTPKGNDIHEVGIAPDEEVELDTEAYVKDGLDNQLERAKEILSGEIKE